MRRVIWLDDHRESPPPPYARLIEDEVALLRAIATEESLFVRGESLCRWARSIAQSRNWRVLEIGQPSEDLRAACPSLTSDEATDLIDRLGPRLWDLDRPLRPREVAHVLWGEDFWIGPTGRDHAAHWLCWLIDHNPTGGAAALVGTISDQWRSETVEPLARCYQASDRVSAMAVLEEWLGLAVDAPDREWPAFPLSPLPPTISRALHQLIRQRLIETDGTIIGSWLDEPLSRDVTLLVAREAKTFFRNHPNRLQSDVIGQLARILTPTDIDELRRLRPPADPGDPPADVRAVVKWYREQYLPWREWTVGTQEPSALERARELGRQFGLWYLSAYLRLWMGGEGHDLLTWIRTRQLQESTPSWVTLLLVLDGLGNRDLPVLLKQITETTTRLVVRSNDVSLAPLPTVTEFAKPALLHGLPPDLVQFDEGPDVPMSRLTAVIDALNSAAPGTVIAWRLVEPDRTYHQARDWNELQHDVAGRLTAIARQLGEVVERVSAEIRLRIVLTSDHGRLLGRSRRTLRVPAGCQSHGRAAWGTIRQDGLEFRDRGYIVKGDVAILDASTYRLPEEHVHFVSLTDACFETNDGRGGEEWFPHGGVFPEEVFVPWIELTRDSQIFSPELALTGHGRAQGAGHLELSIMNSNEFPLVVEWIELRVGEQARRIPLRATVGPQTRETVHSAVEHWPTREECQRTTAVVDYRLPNGDMRSQPVSAITLESEALYEKTNILEDLP
ncbi:MAG: hypothetical protein QJR03_10320 [Sphaerobacter sp.]|nr:hypothetical protein [Sphaerobacter sp.]